MYNSLRIKYNIIFYIILSIATVIRLVGLNKGIWLDEYSSLEVALFNNGNIVESLRNYDHPPLYYIILKIWSFISINEIFLRTPSIIFGLLTLIFIIYTIKPYSLSGSLVSGFAFATIPIFIRYSQEIRDYSLLFLGISASFYYLMKLISENRNIWYILFSISLIVIVSTNLIGIMIIPSIIVFLIPYFFSNSNKIILKKIFISISTAVIVFMFIYLVFLKNQTKSNWWMPKLDMNLFISMYKYIFSVRHIFYLVAYFNSIKEISFASLFDYITKLALVTCGVILLFQGGWKKSWNWLLSALTYWIQIILFSIMILPIFWYRTIMPGLLIFIYFLGVQSGTIKSIKLKIISYISISILCSLALLGWLSTEARIQGEPWRELSASLRSEYSLNDTILFYPIYTKGPVKYYFPDIREENTLSLKIGENISNIEATLKEKINNTDEFFLIVRKDGLVDKDKFYQDILTYLQSKAVIEKKQDFGVLSITKYIVR